MQETPQQYTQRLLSYSQGKKSLSLQQDTPRKLAALLKGKSKKQLARRPAPDKWSVAEIVAHLADAEVVTAWRLRQILSTNGISVQAYDQNSWAATFDYAHRDPKQSLEMYRALRNSNIALLKTVPRKLWDNYGVHQERGNESITHLARLIAGHDLNHLQQVKNVLKAAR